MADIEHLRRLPRRRCVPIFLCLSPPIALFVLASLGFSLVHFLHRHGFERPLHWRQIFTAILMIALVLAFYVQCVVTLKSNPRRKQEVCMLAACMIRRNRLSQCTLFILSLTSIRLTISLLCLADCGRVDYIQHYGCLWDRAIHLLHTRRPGSLSATLFRFVRK